MYLFEAEKICKLRGLCNQNFSCITGESNLAPLGMNSSIITDRETPCFHQLKAGRTERDTAMPQAKARLW